MNTGRLFFALIAIAFTVTSCAYQEEAPVSTVPAGDVTITAYLELQQDVARTSLNSDNKVLWSAGDAFSLLTDKSNDRFELTGGAGTASASFFGSVSGPAPFYALYPYSAENRIENGSLKFNLPQEQTFVNGSFASGASPAVAALASASDAAQFRNLCGVIQINLCGSSSNKVKGVEVINLDGKPLWGDCTVALDGKQGTENQTMTITGGSNVLKVNFDNETALKASTPTVIDAVVPAGSFAKGFSVRVLDATGAVISFLTAQNDKVKIARSFITSMDQLKIPANGEPLDVNRRGFYKDVFMSGGVGLTSRTTLPACPYIGYSLDYMATADSIFQRNVLVQSDNDANGAVLYPDGKARYRIMYTNGGNAMTYSKSLNQAGRNSVINFVHGGGSYIGSCAGAFFACKYKYVSGKVTDYGPEYIGIWPGCVQNTNLSDAYTGCTINKDSPLLQYYDFGGNYHIDSLRHNGGCFCYVDAKFPANGEILALYDLTGMTTSVKFHNKPVIWSVKEKEEWGRVISCGSHPEGVTSGKKRDLMAAMLLYAADGVGSPAAKVTLKNGVAVNLDQKTGARAGIGDKQYHHFAVNIPEGAKNIKVSVEGTGNLDLHLAMRKGDIAWRSDADILLAQAGGKKNLEFDTLEAGTWFISVYCPAEIKTTCATDKFSQTGNIEALNGVPYTISISWD